MANPRTLIATDRTASEPVSASDAGGGACARAPGQSHWYLTGRPDQEGSLQEIAISSGPFRVGRHPDNQLRLSNSTISGHHAELFFVADDLFIRDLQSTNGTLINGRRIRTASGLREGDTIHFGTVMYTVQRHGQDLKETVTTDVLQEVAGHLNFDRLLSDPALRPWFQPIVRMQDGNTVAWEVLARSQLAGLENPASMFRVAAERGSEAMLSSLSRNLGLYAAGEFDISQPLYLNTHPVELNRPELVDSLHVLRSRFPDAPVTIEVHECSITSTEFLRDFRDQLNQLNMSLAYDDFGAGQARLLELIEVPPDVLKFDMKFVRGIHDAPAERRRMVRSLVEIVRNLNVVPLAEGVETEQEADACHELGFELAQGFFFGHPCPAEECGHASR